MSHKIITKYNLEVIPVGNLCDFCDGIAAFEIRNPKKNYPRIVHICNPCVTILIDALEACKS